MWALFLIVPTGRATLDDLPDRRRSRDVFQNNSTKSPRRAIRGQDHRGPPLPAHRHAARPLGRPHDQTRPARHPRRPRRRLHLPHRRVSAPAASCRSIAGNVRTTRSRHLPQPPALHQPARQRPPARQMRPLRVQEHLRRIARPRPRRLWRYLRRGTSVLLPPCSTSPDSGPAKPNPPTTCATAAAARPGIGPHAPPDVVWNITRTCNLRCIHCYCDSEAKA